MSELSELRDYGSALRQQIKAGLRTMRTMSQMLAEYEELIDEFADAQPEEAKRDDYQDEDARPVLRR